MARAATKPTKGKPKPVPSPAPKTKAKTKAKAKAKATGKAKPAAKAKPLAKTKRTAGAKAKPAAKAKPTAKRAGTAAKARSQAKATNGKGRLSRSTRGRHGTSARHGGGQVAEPISESSDAIPSSIAAETSTEAHRRLFTARDRAVRSSPVVEILDDPHPIGALRRFLDSIKGEATPQQAQIALGSAQLMLMPMGREHRGGHEAKELVDLLLHHWRDFGERRKGFHAQEFLKNAFIALGVDRERVAQLEALIPENASSELLFNLGCAYAVSRDKVAMLRVVERALEAGASPTEFRRDADFAVYTNDPDLAGLLTRAEVPQIPVDVEPYLPGVRSALDSLLSCLKEFGESVELRPPVRLDAILDAERAGKISLPNDYRALLTITNGMRLWEHEFFGAGDYLEHTKLAARAQEYLGSSLGITGLVECVPLASWGQPTDWLLYDPRGRLRAGEPGYVLMLNADGIAVDDLVTALAHMENLAREVLGTN